MVSTKATPQAVKFEKCVWYFYIALSFLDTSVHTSHFNATVNTTKNSINLRMDEKPRNSQPTGLGKVKRRW